MKKDRIQLLYEDRDKLTFVLRGDLFTWKKGTTELHLIDVKTNVRTRVNDDSLLWVEMIGYLTGRGLNKKDDD